MCTTSGYADHSGKEYSKTFRTKKEAEAFEIAERAARMRGVWVDPRLGCHSCRGRRREVAWSKRGKAARLHRARPRASSTATSFRVIGQKAVGSVSRADVQRLVDEWTSSHAPASTVRMYAVLRALMSYAEDSEIIARSPCRRIRLPRISPRVAEILDADRLASSPTPWARTVRWLTWERLVCDGVRSPDYELTGWTSCGRPSSSTVRSPVVSTVK